MNMQNPLLQSLWEITSHEIAEDLTASYNKIAGMYPLHYFRTYMAKVCKQIYSLQDKCKPGTSFIVAGLFLAQPEEDDGPEEIEQRDYIKAAIAWKMMKDHQK